MGSLEDQTQQYEQGAPVTHLRLEIRLNERLSQSGHLPYRDWSASRDRSSSALLSLGPAPQRRPRFNSPALYAIHENMTPSYDPNFPADLNIEPLANSASDADTRFDSTAQEGAIRTYGIAGRIW